MVDCVNLNEYNNKMNDLFDMLPTFSKWLQLFIEKISVCTYSVLKLIEGLPYYIPIILERYVGLVGTCIIITL